MTQRKRDTDKRFVWLTYKQAAARLGVHPVTVRKMVAAGDLTAVPRVRLNGVAGRNNAIPESELERFMAQQMQSTEGTNHVGTDTEERRTSAAAGSSNR